MSLIRSLRNRWFRGVVILASVAMFYFGDLNAATVYDRICLGQAAPTNPLQLTIEPAFPQFSFLSLTICGLVCVPSVLFVKRFFFQMISLATYIGLMIESSFYLVTSFQSVECYNSGGSRDSYDAPALFAALVFVFVVAINVCLLLVECVFPASENS